MQSDATTDEETSKVCAFTGTRPREKIQKRGDCGFVLFDVPTSLRNAKNANHRSIHAFAANILSKVSIKILCIYEVTLTNS